MIVDTFMGYPRPDGHVGVRNLVAVIPSCGCANHAARLIASAVPGAVLIDYQGGCSQTEMDLGLAMRILTQMGQHPNVIGSVVVSLGCESLDAHGLTEQIGRGWAPCELVVIQEVGGTRAAVERGCQYAREMAQQAMQKRQPCPASSLLVGLECGGSDATSGLAANPAVGAFTDRLIAQGGSAILSETSELLGAEHILSNLAANDAVRKAMLAIVKRVELQLKATGEDLQGKQPSPGNIEGGITTVEEKALGDVLKGGSSPIVDVLEYGELPRVAGLSFMDTPGNDPASVTAMAAAGCQIVTFTTGRGTPLGNALAPVLKITANGETYRRMGSDIDIDASSIISSQATIAEVGQCIYEAVLAAASGEPTSAEFAGHNEFAIVRNGPTY